VEVPKVFAGGELTGFLVSIFTGVFTVAFTAIFLAGATCLTAFAAMLVLPDAFGSTFFLGTEWGGLKVFFPALAELLGLARAIGFLPAGLTVVLPGAFFAATTFLTGLLADFFPDVTIFFTAGLGADLPADFFETGAAFLVGTSGFFTGGFPAVFFELGEAFFAGALLAEPFFTAFLGETLIFFDIA
jgi:hypothetical protein